MAKKDVKVEVENNPIVQITAPNIKRAQFKIVGITPYVQLRFSKKAEAMMRSKMEGKIPPGRKARDPRDFDDDFTQAMYMSTDGWRGIPASSFRNAMISACRLVNFKMTLAKLSIFIAHDGLDSLDPIPLVRIEGEPKMIVSNVRNATGVADLRVRASFWPWSALLSIRYDGDQFRDSDIGNLLSRVGMQVGIGEGRPDGKSSAGMGWGTFELEGRK